MTRAQYDVVIRGGMVVDGTGGEPFVADVAIDGETIAAIGTIDRPGVVEVDATGLLVTPGFVDIHTHYDGQVIWDSCLAPSSVHGVTTVVMGNCGVGFAPCHKEDHERLIELMEGVEDVPGVVMSTGLNWDWTTYPEYLDAVEARPHDINVASYFPHAPLRVYVMRERACRGQAANPADVAMMADLTREAMEAGAIGFATSRNMIHRSSSGEVIPTVDATERELTAIAIALREKGEGVVHIVNDFKGMTDVPGEFDMMKRMLRASGAPLSLPAGQSHSQPEAWRDIVARVEEANADGLTITAQTMPRGTGMLFGFELSAHPFLNCPSYAPLADLPFEARLALLRDPDVRSRLIAETPVDDGHILAAFLRKFEGMYPAGDPIDYEPSPDAAVAVQALAKGVTGAEVAFDLMMANNGRGLLFCPFGNYAYGNLDAVYEMLKHENFILGMGDGGAHYGFICDASYPTYLLTHWTRDRTRGGKISIATAVKMLTQDTARLVSFHDRGRLAPGYRADVNIIDYDRLTLHAPHVQYDLPAQGRRVMQRADGYVATFVNGTLVYREGEHTGALPGRLVRGSQPAPVLHA